MNQFHTEFVAEAWLFCSTFGALFTWILVRHAVWPQVRRRLRQRTTRA